LVEDLQLGPGSTNPVPLADAGLDRLLVAAGTSVDRALYIVGGPVAAMTQASDILATEIVGPPGANRLVIADDGFYGDEVFRLIEVAPGVVSTVISGGAAQRSTIQEVQLTFNFEVDISGDPFTIVNTTTSETVNHVAAVTNQGGQTVVDFTFLSGPSVNANGLLLDGVYELTVGASQVSSLGLTLDGDGDGTSGDNYVFGDEAVDMFFRKYGDNDGNNTVNLFDFAAFRATFGVAPGQPGYNAAMDNDGDGNINLFDFAAFRANFGT
jgi:hypothetical protein